MPPVLLRRLCEILGDHTQSPDRCRFCLWDGYGWIGNAAMATAHASTQGPVSGDANGAAGQPPDDMELTLPPVFTEEIVQGPRVHLPQRSYFLLQGPLDAAMELGWMLDASHFSPQSPNLFWPNDHSWCVATEIDLDSSYVGGSKELVQRLVADEELEALVAAPEDPVDSRSDKINRLEQGIGRGNQHSRRRSAPDALLGLLAMDDWVYGYGCPRFST
jgi:hypothetical protein